MSTSTISGLEFFWILLWTQWDIGIHCLHLQVVQSLKDIVHQNWGAYTLLVLTPHILMDICAFICASCGNSPIGKPHRGIGLWPSCRLEDPCSSFCLYGQWCIAKVRHKFQSLIVSNGIDLPNSFILHPCLPLQCQFIWYHGIQLHSLNQPEGSIQKK